MRKFVAVFIATVAGLVVLLSFKTAPTKTPPAAALGSATPGSPPASSAPAVASSADPAVSSAAVASSVPATTPTAAATPTTAPTTSPKPAPSTSPRTSPKPAPSTPASTTKTVTGSPVVVSEGRREFGVITVQLTFVNGKITKATASEPTTDERSREIASFSIPVLDREAVSSQSAQIDAVSGATITSGAYAQSLQSAIDKAKA